MTPSSPDSQQMNHGSRYNGPNLDLDSKPFFKLTLLFYAHVDIFQRWTSSPVPPPIPPMVYTSLMEVYPPRHRDRLQNIYRPEIFVYELHRNQITHRHKLESSEF